MRLLLLILSLLAIAASNAQTTVLRAGDAVRVICEEDPTFGGDLDVLADGTLEVPRVGRVLVSGLTEDEASRRLSGAIAARGLLDSATVSVRLRAARGIVTFSGAVSSHGEIALVPGLRLGDVVKRAKPTEGADLGNIRIKSRSGPPRTVKFAAGTEQGDPHLRAGDEVYFPIYARSPEVYVLGAVGKPGAIAFVEGLTALRAIEQAGGTGPHARPRRAILVKTNGESWPLDLEPDARDVPLEAGDKIFVPQTADQRFVTVRGAVAKPGAIEFVPGMTAEKAVEEAGGLLPGADAKSVWIKRFLPDKNPRSDERALQPFDIVEAPYPGRQRPSGVDGLLRLIPMFLGLPF